MMLIEKQVQLIERVPGHLPVMFLIHVAERHRIREKLIQVFGAGSAGLFVQGNWQFGNLAVWLNFGAALMLHGLRSFGAGFQLVVALTALAFFGAHGSLLLFEMGRKGC